MPLCPAAQKALLPEPVCGHRLDLLYATLPLLLELAPQLGFALSRSTVHGGELLEKRLTLALRRLKLLLVLVALTEQLLLCILEHASLAPQTLLGRAARARDHRRTLPIHTPTRVRCNELGLGQARSRLLEQVALMHLVRPHLMPCRPAHRELPVHHALEPKLRQVLHALLLLLLKLLLGEAHHLGLLAAPVQHRRTRVGELLA